MSRSRNIKPGFFKNEVLASLPYEYRLLFAGLWTLADRAGRLEDRPVRIKMELFAADNVDVNAGLSALHKAGFILRYSADEIQYIQVLAWDKHQNPHVKEKASTIPAPCKHSASTVQVPEIPERARLIPDSLNLIPDSKALVHPSAARFAEFWQAYPVKKGKKDAQQAWKSKGCDAFADKILAHVARMKAVDSDWQRGYAPHGPTYLRGERWNDEPVGPRMPANAGPSRQGAAITEIQRMIEDCDNGTGSNGAGVVYEGSGHGIAGALLPRT